jgi:hypothetical protein
LRAKTARGRQTERICASAPTLVGGAHQRSYPSVLARSGPTHLRALVVVPEYELFELAASLEFGLPGVLLPLVSGKLSLLLLEPSFAQRRPIRYTEMSLLDSVRLVSGPPARRPGLSGAALRFSEQPARSSYVRTLRMYAVPQAQPPSAPREGQVTATSKRKIQRHSPDRLLRKPVALSCGVTISAEKHRGRLVVRGESPQTGQ